MSRDVRLFLIDMAEACDCVAAYIAGLDASGFAADKKTRDAVIRNIEIVGEAAKNVPDHVRALAQEVPWKRIAGMRDMIVHDYFGIDDAIVWNVAIEHLPPLCQSVRALLAHLEPLP